MIQIAVHQAQIAVHQAQAARIALRAHQVRITVHQIQAVQAAEIRTAQALQAAVAAHQVLEVTAQVLQALQAVAAAHQALEAVFQRVLRKAVQRAVLRVQVRQRQAAVPVLLSLLLLASSWAILMYGAVLA